jgi:hypothetical protein
MARPTCADAAQPCPPVSMGEKRTRGVAFLSFLTLRPKMTLFYHYTIGSGSTVFYTNNEVISKMMQIFYHFV